MRISEVMEGLEKARKNFGDLECKILTNHICSRVIVATIQDQVALLMSEDDLPKLKTILNAVVTETTEFKGDRH